MIKRLLPLLLLAIPTFAQTTVNLTVRDTPDNQTWNNGTWTVQLIGTTPGQTSQFSILSGGGSLAAQSGNLSTTGTASMSLPANANIAPTSIWQFTVCSQQGTACSISNVTVVTSSPQSLTLTPPSIRVAALINLPPIVVYTTTEVAFASLGSQITVVGSTPSTPALQSCTAVSGNTCTTWASAGGGGSGVTNVTSNPATCSPPQSFFNTVTQQFLQCIATNTLSAVGDFLGTGPGTTPTATNGLPSVIQGVGTGGNTATWTSVVNTSQGDSIVVVGRVSGSGTIQTPTDTQGNTYTSIINPCTVSTFPMAVYIASGIVGGPDTITFNVTGGTANFSWVETTPAVLDAVSTCATGTSTTPTTNSVTTTNATDLLLLVGQNTGSVQFTTSLPLINIEPVSSTEFAAYRQVFTAGSYTASSTLASSQSWAAVIVALKGNAPTILGGSPTLNPGTQTALCTITTGNQVCQFAVRASSQTFPAGQITINVTGGITSIWPANTSGAGTGNCVTAAVCVSNYPSSANFILEASTDAGTSWAVVPGLSKEPFNFSPTSSAVPVFSGQYNITGLSGAWFRFSVTAGYSISNLVVTVSLG